MWIVEIIFHEFFSFNYQLFLFLLLLCHDVKWRKQGIFRYIVLALVACIPSSIYYAVLHRIVFNQWIFTFGSWYSNYYIILTFYAAIVLLASCEITIKGAAFYAIGAYIMEHLAANCYLLFAALLGIDYMNLWYQAARFVLLLILILIFQCLIRPHLRRDVREINIESTPMIFFLLIAIILINVLTSWIYYREEGQIIKHPGYCVYGIISSVLLFLIQYGLLNFTEAVNEKKIMHEMLKTMERQYRLSKENVDALNAKYHDFKYRILELVNSDASTSNRTYLKESLDLIETYQNAFQTGNEALNVLLTEKSAVCAGKGIDLTCFVDGEALSFLEYADIYILFGNALDNAIEALDQEDNIQKIINLNVCVKNNFLVISVENPCDKAVAFSGGVPQTSKKDTTSHGFGTKSIKYIAEKYGGNAVLKWENGEFTVDCLIPIPEK